MKKSGIAAAAAAFVLVATTLIYPVTVAEFENASRGRTVLFRVDAGEVFSVTYHHSMYDQPITEEFTVGDDGGIVLKALWSPSGAVREYFGITAPGDYHVMNRVMPEVVFRVAAGVPQRMKIGGAEHSFLELGEHGDRIVLRGARKPLAAYLANRR
ncbi:MAG: hypothetical protein HYU77_09035 [Betaproteobacteria bacterium]|nr:hypothetical protein [Betaproteobacteria bacterium]